MLVYFVIVYMYYRPIGYDQRVQCVISTLAFDLGCRHCLCIHSTADLCRFCVLSLRRKVGDVRRYTR